MNLVSKVIDLMEEFVALDIQVTEITINKNASDQLATECHFPFRGATLNGFMLNGAKVVVTEPKRTEKQQLIDRLRACADQLEKSE